MARPTNIGKALLQTSVKRNGRNLPKATQQLSPDLQRKTTLVLEKYGSRDDFLVTMNPDTQIFAARHQDRAFFGEAPTLATLKAAYGPNTPTMWLLPQILDLVIYCNSKGTLNNRQAQFLADAIANDYYYLKVSEFLLFFYRFKLGNYGNFYGVVDPMLVTVALEKFIKERNDVISRMEQEKADAERAKLSDNAITPAEYCRRAGFPQFTDVADVARYKARCDNFIDTLCRLIHTLCIIAENLEQQHVK